MKKLFILPIVFLLMVLPVIAEKELTISGVPTIKARFDETFSDSFSIQNTGDERIDNIEFSVSTSLEDFDLSFNPGNLNLEAGDSAGVEISGSVPEEKEVGTYQGTVTVNGDGYSTYFTLTIEVQSMLEITDFDAEAGDRDWNDVDDGDTLGGIRPGTTLKLEIELKNRFSSDSDIDINDVTITATINGIDDNDDIEEESDEMDIDAGDDETFKIELKIPTHADDDDYSMEIVAEGRDDNGVEHKVEWELTVGVKREAHNLKVSEIRITPSTVSCTRRATITIDIVNLGRNDEDNAAIEISNNALDLNERELFEIEKDIDENEKTFSYPIAVPSATPQGTYPITVRLYYQADRLMDVAIANLVVGECGTASEEPEQNESEEEEEQITGGAVYIEGQEGEGTVINREKGFSLSNYLIMVLIGGVVLILLIVILVVRFLV